MNYDLLESREATPHTMFQSLRDSSGRACLLKMMAEIPVLSFEAEAKLGGAYTLFVECTPISKELARHLREARIGLERLGAYMLHEHLETNLEREVRKELIRRQKAEESKLVMA